MFARSDSTSLRRVSRVAATTAAHLLCAILILSLAACGRGGVPADPPTDGNPGALRIAVVGDSITVADSPDFARGEFGQESWVSYVSGADFTFVGGWARWGASTEEMARNAPQVDSDVLVIMAGTNDVALGVPFREVSRNLDLIAETVGAPDVLLSGIPPLDHAPRAAADFNHNLETFAIERGWQWVDAGSAVRTADQTFASGMASDGVHPTQQGAELLGEEIKAALQELAATQEN